MTTNIQQKKSSEIIEDVLRKDNNETPIQEFYNKKILFLTGGTGFFGKIIMEKLLRVTEIEHIYLLVRNKKGKDIHTRLDDVFDDPVFDHLKSVKKKFRHKVSCINGDCSLPELGIQIVDKQFLIETIDLVIHAAATVRFDEKLKTAIGINVCGTKEILQLCKMMKNLKACVHVSTAFANCNHKHIEEKFYRMKLSGDNSIRLYNCLDDKIMDNIQNELIMEYPNTYTFTKALAEDLVRNNSKDLPIAIFRPGIVISTYKEPIPGWIDNMYGPCGLIVGVGAGIVRTFLGSLETCAHIVPVDLSVNALLASLWDISKNTYELPPIYNFIPDPTNQLTWGDFVKYGYTYGITIPMSRAIWHQTLTMTSSKFLYTILTFFYHTLPAYLIDIGFKMLGKKPRMMQIYKKVNKFGEVMTYFSTRKWTFANTNTKELWNKLNENDQELFNFNMLDINWKRLIESSLYGLRTYVVKEDPSTIPYALKRNKKLKIIHYFLLYTIYTVGIYLIYLFLIKLYF